MTASYRIALVGASSLRGKELNEALAESSFAASDFLLMDDQKALGQLEPAGEEVVAPVLQTKIPVAAVDKTETPHSSVSVTIGATGALPRITATPRREALSHVDTVCEA